MVEVIDEVIEELENKILTHRRLGIMYEGQEDYVTEDKHYTAAFAYEMALTILKKHYNKERELKLVK